MSDQLQATVASLMPVGIVVLLEEIHVDHHHGKRVAATVGPKLFLRIALIQRLAIADAEQAVQAEKVSNPETASDSARFDASSS